MKKARKWLMIAGIIVLVVSVSVILWRIFGFDKSKVKIFVDGPAQTQSSDLITYTINYANETNVSLTAVRLIINYPQNAVFDNQEGQVESIDLPDLSSKKSASYEARVRLVGNTGDTQETTFKIEYKPSNVSARYDNETKFATKILSVPLSLDFDLPNQIVQDQPFSFALEYTNKSEIAFSDIEIRITYPDSFSFESALPPPSKGNNTWQFANLAAGVQDKIMIRGMMQAQTSQQQQFSAVLGANKDGKFVQIVDELNSVKISSSPLYISLKVNNSNEYIAAANDILDYTINYKNTASVGIRDVQITAKLESPVLDINSLDLRGASFDYYNNVIVWSASSEPELAFLQSNVSGSVNFKVRVKNPLPIQNYSDKNFVIKCTAKIDSGQVPLELKDIKITGEATLETKVKSATTVNALGFYNTDLMVNSGPIPPKVGQITTYVLKWEITNTANDLENTEVVAYLPPNVKWEAKVVPAGENLTYSKGTGKVVWQIGKLAAGTGILSAARWVAWQVSITPSQVDVGSLIDLIGETSASGLDNFTQTKLTSYDTAIDTRLPDDLEISNKDGRVIQ